MSLLYYSKKPQEEARFADPRLNILDALLMPDLAPPKLDFTVALGLGVVLGMWDLPVEMLNLGRGDFL